MGLAREWATVLVGFAVIVVVIAVVGASVFWVLFTGSRAVYVTNQDDERHTVSVTIEGVGMFNGGTDTVECTIPPNSYAKVEELTQAHLVSLVMNPHRVQIGLPNAESRIHRNGMYGRFKNGFTGYKSMVGWIEDDENFDGEDTYDFSKLVFYGKRDPCPVDGPSGFGCIWGEQVSC